MDNFEGYNDPHKYTQVHIQTDTCIFVYIHTHISGGSRISRRGAPTPEAAMFHKICMSKRKNLNP